MQGIFKEAPLAAPMARIVTNEYENGRPRPAKSPSESARVGPVSTILLQDFRPARMDPCHGVEGAGGTSSCDSCFCRDSQRSAPGRPTPATG